MRSIKLKDQQFGDGQRLLHQENELENNTIIPVPVEYDDIDRAMIEFFDSAIDLTDEKGEKVPIFKLLSNQRFSEYSQTWKHTDKDGNLFMNFKTINREVNPSWGTIHSGLANIPGDNRFTILMREIIDNTGVECYEVTSMSQPLSVDLKYTITFVTSKMENLNKFNISVINLFKSKQCYVYPNGHAMPMTLDNIGDDSNYEIDGRKFYSQPVDISLLAYIIPKDDIKVQLVPKKKPLNMAMDNFKRTRVEMNFTDNEEKNFELNVRFNPGINKVSFTLDDKANIELKEKINANNVIIKVNNDIIDISNGVTIDENDNILIKIVQPTLSQGSLLIFKGTLQ